MTLVTPSGLRTVDAPRRRLEPCQMSGVARTLARRASRVLGPHPFARRCWFRLARSDAFEAWAIGWPPGGSIDLHDHGEARGTVLVVSGELTETFIASSPTGDVVTKSTVIPQSNSTSFPRNYIHDVANTGAIDAVSVHVYAPRLRSMTFYDLADGRLTELRTVEYEHP